VVFGPDNVGRDKVGFVPSAVDEGTATLSPHEALKMIIANYQVTDVRVVESDLEDVMRTAYTGKHDVQRLDGDR
jgi:hypothetical protein